MIECVLNYTSTYGRKQVKADNGHWYGHVPKAVEISHEGVESTNAN